MRPALGVLVACASRALASDASEASDVAVGARLVLAADFDAATFNKDWYARVPLRRALARLVSDEERGVCAQWWQDWEHCVADPVAVPDEAGHVVDVTVRARAAGAVSDAEAERRYLTFVRDRAAAAAADGSLDASIRATAREVGDALGERGVEIWGRAAANVDGDASRRALARAEVDVRRALRSPAERQLSATQSYSYALVFDSPAPTAAETATVSISASVVVTGITVADFNSNQAQKDAFADGIIANLDAATRAMNVEITDIVAAAATRRRLQSSNVEVSFTIVIRQPASDYVAGEDQTLLTNVVTALKAAVSSGALAQSLQDEFDDAGISITITVDVNASLATLDAATVTVSVTTPAPVASKKKSDSDDGGLLIIIIVVVVVVVLAAGGGGLFLMQKSGQGASKVAASPHN